MKGLFWCQHLLGIGHLSRSLWLCKWLTQKFSIDFLQGGVNAGLTLSSPHFRHIFLPPLVVKPSERWLMDPEGKRSAEEIFTLRKKMMEESLEHPYDFFITELYPFRKIPFSREVDPLIEELKKQNPHCKIFCSLREGGIGGSREDFVHTQRHLIHTYDHIFVHADPHFFPLDPRYTSLPSLAKKFTYTGFLADFPQAPYERKKQVVVSWGGGVSGDELIEAVLAILPSFPDFHFFFTIGPRASLPLIQELEKTKHERPEQITLSPLVQDFEGLLASSLLSISLPGSTIYNVLHTKTKGLVYAVPGIGFSDKRRLQAFSSKGYLRALAAEELKPFSLEKAIRETLEAPYPSSCLNFKGGKSTLRAIEELLL